MLDCSAGPSGLTLSIVTHSLQGFRKPLQDAALAPSRDRSNTSLEAMWAAPS